jgi:hypothetical protein
MIHPYVVQWLAEGCTVQALPTPRGKRNALLLNRGLVTAVLRLHEEDYQALVAGGPVSKGRDEGGSDGPGAASRGEQRQRTAPTAAGSDVGLVSSGDTGTAATTRASGAVGGRGGSRGGVGSQQS